MAIQGQYFMTSETGPLFPVESFLVEDDGGLDVQYNPGIVRVGVDCVTIAGGTLALGDNTTTYVYIDYDTVTVMSNTSGWPTDSIPLAEVVTSAGDITSIEDERTFIELDPKHVLNPPSYDSGWVTIALDETKTFTHSLGGDADDYLVDVSARLTGGAGVNQINFGSNHIPDGRIMGYYWMELTSSIIKVLRGLEDSTAPEVRVRIWKYS